MRVVGITLVRDEADIVAASIRHQLRVGCESVLVVDNGSTDGTCRILRKLARHGRVRWRSDPGPYDQSGITTALAREAFRAGADWVLPFDADEFWWAPHGGLQDVLARTEAAALRCPVVNFVQRRDQRRRSRRALRHMTYRPPAPAGLREDVERGAIAFVELEYPRKVLFRACAAIDVAPGNHDVSGAPGPTRRTGDLRCLHAPLRSRETLSEKAARAARVPVDGRSPGSSWHIRRWDALASEQRLDDEWAANSYLDGCLDVYGTRRRLVYDPTLRDLVGSLRGTPVSAGSVAGR
jgi:hypothetical protein